MIRKVGVLCALLSTWVVIGAAIAQPARSVHREPSFFSPEEGEESVFHNAPLPSDVVLDALLKTKEAKDYELHEFGREESRKLFRVVKVHLAKQDEVDWIVSGSGRMTGGDNDWFWVVRQVDNHAEVLLYANGLSLVTLKSRTNDYKDIATSWNAASGYSIDETYKYNGSRYKLVHKHTYQQRMQ
jgi:hypothetical protein